MSSLPRMFGVQIANGYSSEAYGFATFLSHVNPTVLEPHVLCHQWEGGGDSAGLFRQASGASTQALDFGWRSMAPSRTFPEKARARLQFLAALPRALALARRLAPDVIYSSQQLWDCQAASYLARKLNKPQVIHLHYTVGPWLHRSVLNRLLDCDHVIAISDFVRQEALAHGVRSERVATIRNPVRQPPLPGAGTREAVRAELGIAPDVLLLGIIARLDPEKGQRETLHALALAIREHPGLQLLVVGDETPWHPGYGAGLAALAAEIGISDHVHFLGRRSDVPRLLAALDVFVHPSRREPFGLAVAEASAAGLPVVAYTEGGTPEIVRNGVTGLLSAPEDLQGLARSLTRLAGDPGYARALGQAGRSLMAAEFQPASAGEAFGAVMQRLAAPAGRP